MTVGSLVARALSQQLDPKRTTVTLIESREYYLHYPGVLRMVVTSEGALEEKVLMPLDKLFASGNGNLVQDSVTSISQNANRMGGVVSTDSGKEYPYDILVLASGSIWEGPLTLPPTKDSAIAEIHAWRDKIKNAKGIAIVGGGAVGSGLFLLLSNSSCPV